MFDFWNEVSEIILGKQTIEDFINKFNIALQKECEYILRGE